MGNKNPTTTNNTSTSPSPQAMQAYESVLNQAQSTAATPYQSYTGQLVAPFNAEQNTGVSSINTYANAAQPAVSYGLQQAAASSSPLTTSQIQQYQSPYTQDVVNATQAQFNNQNQQQQQQVQGNAIAQGALGGNRTAVAQAELANQQQLAQAPVIAGLENTGYQQGVQTAEQQQQTGLAGANAIGNLGIAGQGAGISGAGAQLTAGGQQQATQQALDTALLQQFQQQQAYPFQTEQWLAGIDTGVGSQMGGTSTSQTTQPAPNLLGQIAGGVTSGAGLLGATGAYGSGGWLAGALAGLARGGSVHFPEKENIKSIGKTHDGHVIYMFNYKGNSQPHVSTTHPATKKRADGGVVSFNAGGVAGLATGGSPYSGGTPSSSVMGVAGTPWATAPTYVPTMNITHGHGAPSPGNSSPQQQQTPQQQANSLGSLAKTIKDSVNGVNPGSSVPGAVGDTAVGGPQGPAPIYGGTAQNPLPGLDASDYQMARGGTVGLASGGVAKFADGGTPSFDDRWNAQFNSSAASDQDVIPDPGLQKVDPAAVQAWRDRTDTDNGVTPKQIAAGDVPPPPDGIAPPTRAMSFAKTPSRDADLPPEVALGYSDTGASGIAPASVRAANEPAPTKQGFDWGADNKLWPSLISAGFGMLSSRSPYFGNAVGAGGEAGMASYNQQRKEEVEAQNHAEALAHQAKEEARLEQAQKQSAINQPIIFDANGKPLVNPDYIKAKEAIEKSFKPTWGVIDENPYTQKKTYGWIDPNTKQVYDVQGKPYIPQHPVTEPTPPTTPPAPNAAPGTPQAPGATPVPPAEPLHAADPTAPIGSSVSRNTAFLDKVAKEGGADYALAIKKAADYELDPAKYASMRSDSRQHFINNVLQYDPNYSPQEVGLRYQAQRAYLPGTKTGDTVRSFNTAVAHLDSLGELYKALDSGNILLFNRLRNAYETETGQTVPNTLNGIAQIVGGEVVKATVGSQNALGDREELRKTLDPAISKGQAIDIIKHYQELMGGQLNSLKFAYEQGTGLHNFEEKFLMPRSREVLKSVGSGNHGETKTLSPADQQAFSWAKANPNDPRAAAIMKKLGIQ